MVCRRRVERSYLKVSSSRCWSKSGWLKNCRLRGSGFWARRAALLAGIMIAGASTAGCNDPKCEASRLELVRTWETLRDTATSRKQLPEVSGLSQTQEQDRIRVWTTIEDRAELMRSSFETSQVTWRSADKARADLGEAFRPLASNDDPMTKGFALTLSEADQHMADFRKTCR
jgi:hypothetical protein